MPNPFPNCRRSLVLLVLSHHDQQVRMGSRLLRESLVTLEYCPILSFILQNFTLVYLLTCLFPFCLMVFCCLCYLIHSVLRLPKYQFNLSLRLRASFVCYRSWQAGLGLGQPNGMAADSTVSPTALVYDIMRKTSKRPAGVSLLLWVLF